MKLQGFEDLSLRRAELRRDRNNPSSLRLRMKRTALALFFLLILLISSAAHADNIVVGCPLLEKYSDSDVRMLLSEVRSVLSDKEVGTIWSRYLSLRSACETNSNASRVLPVSERLRNWLAQYGVDVRQLGRRL
jgi:hypothetical protein